jgi:hypothetical protein
MYSSFQIQINCVTLHLVGYMSILEYTSLYFVQGNRHVGYKNIGGIIIIILCLRNPVQWDRERIENFRFLYPITIGYESVQLVTRKL